MVEPASGQVQRLALVDLDRERRERPREALAKRSVARRRSQLGGIDGDPRRRRQVCGLQRAEVWRAPVDRVGFVCGCASEVNVNARGERADSASGQTHLRRESVPRRADIA